METYLPVMPPLAALVLFAVWAMILVVSVGIWRTVLVFTGNAQANSFPSGTQHGGDRYWRLNRAHMNAVENLPIFGALVLSGFYLQVQDTWLQILPSLILYARVAQSLIHIASGSAVAVTLRFLAYGVQLISMFILAVVVGKAAGVPFLM
ncbi:MAG: MAPEG family protein [Alphaproteobacteria bacterium]|nr:MAPEG family protein [Alphaproteobacteria bacterium]